LPETVLTLQQLYHGTRADLKRGDSIEPGATYVYLTPDLDAAIWESEVAAGEGPGRVYVVEPTGTVEEDPELAGTSTGIPRMSYRSAAPLRVMGEVTEWRLYHGTRADLQPGDLIRPGYVPNFGKRDRTTTHVYMSRTLNAATWGAELAAGEGRGRIYIVEPTGPVEEDPELTDRKFRGNPTKSFRSREPLRVVGEVADWKGHSAEALQAMKDGLERLARLGVEPMD